MSRRKLLLGANLAGGLGVIPWASVSLLVEEGRKCGVMQVASRVLSQENLAKGAKPGADGRVRCSPERTGWWVHQAYEVAGQVS